MFLSCSVIAVKEHVPGSAEDVNWSLWKKSIAVNIIQLQKHQ